MSIALNRNVLIPKPLQPDYVNLWNFKLTLISLPEFIIWNIKDLRNHVVKIFRLENHSLWQKKSFPLMIVRFFVYMSFYFCTFIYMSFYFCLFICHFISVYLHIILFLFIYMSFYFCIFTCHFISVYLHVILFLLIYMSFYICLFTSHFISVYFCSYFNISYEQSYSLSLWPPSISLIS